MAGRYPLSMKGDICMTSQRITLEDVMSLPSSSLCFEDLIFTQDEYDHCPAIWNGDCDYWNCGGANPLSDMPCAQDDPLLSPWEAEVSLCRLYDGPVHICWDCGYEYGTDMPCACHYKQWDNPEPEFEHEYECVAIHKCQRCGMFFGDPETQCPNCQWPEPLTCESTKTCALDDCKYFWWEGMDAGCSLGDGMPFYKPYVGERETQAA